MCIIIQIVIIICNFAYRTRKKNIVQKLYFATKIILTYWEKKKCSSDGQKLLKFEAEGQEFAKKLGSVEQFIETVKSQNIFWWQNSFLTCSWRFLRSNKSEQLEFKLEKIIWI